MSKNNKVNFDGAYLRSSSGHFWNKFHPPTQGNLYQGGLFLGCSFGIYCTYVWAVGILASGQSSTMTGTYSGQFAMQVSSSSCISWLVVKHWSSLNTRGSSTCTGLNGRFSLSPVLWPWSQQVPTCWPLITTYVFFAALVLFWTDMQTATFLNDFLNTVMSIMLPFAIMPTLCFTSSPFVMGEFANGFFNKIAVCALSLIVICINMMIVVQYVQDFVPSEWVQVYSKSIVWMIPVFSQLVFPPPHLTGCRVLLWLHRLPPGLPPHLHRLHLNRLLPLCEEVLQVIVVIHLSDTYMYVSPTGLTMWGRWA